ncbi:GL21198 [Drosophila persimilis]|uniref:GL21198 n=1 Tax=Drosophila persimilis TaxID=7234 RepID=B4GWU8_DROPE|nr:GL21198 [Drosophila persimilis]
MAIYLLYSEEREKLDNWLQTWDIKLDYRTRHQFRDAMPVARLVDKIHKNLVDLSIYRACTSVPMMQKNWKIFKIHVLNGLKIGLTAVDQKQLALGTEGAIDQLLFFVMYSQNEHL